MAGQKKFGAFDGVFTPSLLTILGVIMYMRLGWVVGNAGMWGAIIIVVIAHVISISTGLSISSIATDKKVGAGGVYYVLSRSLGLPIGGAIGMTLFTGTAFSIALYLVGFSESFNAYLGLDTSINGLRSTGSLTLLALTVLAFVSTSIAIRAQFFIMAAIAISLVAIFFGHSDFVPESVPAFGGADGVPMETVFAIFFPAVTGFTAGIAMSGDLGNPKKAIPVGTIAAIGVGFVVYIGLVFFLGSTVAPEILRTDNNIMMKIALFAPAVVAGIWGATLSSALGGILGGPRILQAMSVDRITPKLFGKGVGLGNEPRNALILTVIIAEAGILIGELDMIARVVSMFYLAAYSFINIAFFLESWASSDFKPTFRVNKWIGFTGFVATFVVMFKLDMLAMVAAFVIIGGIFVWLQRKQIALGTGDIWQSVWSTVVKKGLKHMESADDHKRNWKPNILLFSGSSEQRPYLLEFSKTLAGQAGMVTNFDLVENKGAKVLFPKHQQNTTDELLQKYGIFGRRIEVKNVFKGIETIATTFGFSGIDPNTVLMGWAKNTKDPIWFAQMTKKLIDLDYNVLYLDYDNRWGFRKKEQIDLWWRGLSNSAELMLHLAKFISVSPDWRHAKIRVLLVNNYNIDRQVIENRIQRLLDEYRMEAEIKVINNEVDKTPYYELMKVISADADLIFTGIPNIKPGEEASFVEKTTELVSVIGTTLMVKASSTFEVTKLALHDMEKKEDYQVGLENKVTSLGLPTQLQLAHFINALDEEMASAAVDFSNQTLAVLQQHYLQFISEIEAALSSQWKGENESEDASAGLEALVKISQKFSKDELPILKDILSNGISKYMDETKKMVDAAPASISIDDSGKVRNIKWKNALQYYHEAKGGSNFHEALYEMGTANALLVIRCSKAILSLLKNWRGQTQRTKHDSGVTENLLKDISCEFAKLRQSTSELAQKSLVHLRNADREICNQLAIAAADKFFNKNLSAEESKLSIKKTKAEIKKIKKYAASWHRNQSLFHKQFETGLQIAQSISQLYKSKENAIKSIQIDYVEKLKAKIIKLQAALAEAKTNHDKKKLSGISSAPFQLQEGDIDNTDKVYQSFTESLQAIGQKLPEEVELMDVKSLDIFMEEQDEGVQTVKLSIAKIADYLIETNFVSPFQDKLSSLGQHLNRVSGSVFNNGSLLAYGIDMAKEDKNIAVLPEIIEKATAELALNMDATETIFRNFVLEINEKFDSTEAKLGIGRIVSEADELLQYVNMEGRRKGIKAWQQNAEKALKGSIKWVFDFIDRRKEDVAMATFEREHEALRDDRDILRNFMEKISGTKEAATHLPFYYRQLFSGKHLNLSRYPESRQTEIEEVKKALEQLKEGISGGIMVTGEALSGKTFFAEYIAKQMLPGKIYRAIPPANAALTKSALQKAFEHATGLEGPPEAILRRLKPGATIILDDIEGWWLKASNGETNLNSLVDIIRKFGKRHHFLITCNLHTLKILRRTTKIDSALIATIILTPLSRENLKQVIWSRHKTGGLHIYFKGVEEEHLSEKAKHKLFSQIHQLSSGNVGFGLRLWLANLRTTDGENIELRYPADVEFPSLKDSDWHYLLLQLYLHKSLSRMQLEQLFAKETKAWIDHATDELNKSKVIELHTKDLYVLKPEFRHHLEKWLKEKEMI
ncbi:MAG: hypothetical protein K9J37_13440 [Saprospiraceae bacterium]|nr:hypothetical protein [Saprospiraceae bacterium]MCF8250912.1 hypothetical protein [Saprospiraceae bacterium]MCF8282702.1 hypothetical protein [Bacteroidales bacterium]MCF8311877.1 hypothetical protein [Saprospiraceae bacterium]MCF8443010.1 hypothetical protein [Saprospiraceae bacterium]